jgi:hypothetical protein
MTDAQRQLHRALNAHKFDLEIERAVASRLRSGRTDRGDPACFKMAGTSDFQTGSARSIHAASGRKFAAGEDALARARARCTGKSRDRCRGLTSRPRQNLARRPIPAVMTTRDLVAAASISSTKKSVGQVRPVAQPPGSG